MPSELHVFLHTVMLQCLHCMFVARVARWHFCPKGPGPGADGFAIATAHGLDGVRSSAPVILTLGALCGVGALCLHYGGHHGAIA